MSNLQNLWMDGICELENASMHCTNNAENVAELDEVEFIDLCSVSQNNNEAQVEGKESTKQESQDKTKNNTLFKTAMMCW